MRRNNKALFAITFTGFLWIVLFGALTGCQTTFNKYLGKTVPEPNRIPLSEGKPQSSLWQTKDLFFQYTCLQEFDKMSLSGELQLDESYEQFETLNYLHLWVHFLDSEAKILDSKLVWSIISKIAFTGQKKKWPVKSTLDLPLNTTAVSFSYSGSVTQSGGGIWGGDRDSTNWSFYKSPLT